MRFCDLQDSNHVYSAGDTFPRDGMEVSAERIDELAGHRNRLGVPLIAESAEKPKKARKTKSNE